MQPSSSHHTLTRSAVLFGIFGRGMGYGCLGGAGLGALFGTLIAPVFGTIVGLPLGAVVGAVAGLANSVVIGLVTICCFYPLRNLKAFMWIIYSLGMYFTFVVSLAGFAIFWSNGDGLLVPRMTDDVLYVQSPTVIACGFALFVIHRITRWYVRVAPSEPDMARIPRWLRQTFIILIVGIACLPILWFIQQRTRIIFRGAPNEEVTVFTNYQSYLMRIAPDGSSEARLTYHIDSSVSNNSISTIHPQHALDGQGIVYSSNHILENDGTRIVFSSHRSRRTAASDIYVINADGS